MFIFLSKLLPLLLYPVGLVFILIIVAILARKKPAVQITSLILVLLILFVFGNRWVSLSLARSLEWRYLPPNETPQADVIVVLAGGTQSAQFPRPITEINGAGDRIIYAAQLYHEGASEKIVLSGGRIDWLARGAEPTDDMAEILTMLDVPPEVLLYEPDSRNTYENAVNTYNILEPMGIKKIILVTSAAHMPRAVALFEHQGFEVIPAPTDYTVTEANWAQLVEGSLASKVISLVPNVENISLSTSTMKEYIGVWIYRLRGWL